MLPLTLGFMFYCTGAVAAAAQLTGLAIACNVIAGSIGIVVIYRSIAR